MTWGGDDKEGRGDDSDGEDLAVQDASQAEVEGCLGEASIHQRFREANTGEKTQGVKKTEKRNDMGRRYRRGEHQRKRTWEERLNKIT